MCIRYKAFFQYVYIFRINKVLLSAEFYAEMNFCTQLDSKAHSFMLFVEKYIWLVTRAMHLYTYK